MDILSKTSAMTINGVGSAFLSDEQPLAIALTVFVMLTALLIAFIVLLFALPKFRAVFFHDGEGNGKEKAEKPDKSDEKKQADKKPADKNKKAEKKKKPSRNGLPYVDSVPTVPLGEITADSDGGEENIMKRTTEAYRAIGLGKPKRSDAPAAKPEPKPDRGVHTHDKIQTVVIPATSTSDSPARPITRERPVTNERPATKTGPAKKPAESRTSAQKSGGKKTNGK